MGTVALCGRGGIGVLDAAGCIARSCVLTVGSEQSSVR